MGKMKFLTNIKQKRIQGELYDNAGYCVIMARQGKKGDITPRVKEGAINERKKGKKARAVRGTHDQCVFTKKGRKRKCKKKCGLNNK